MTAAVGVAAAASVDLLHAADLAEDAQIALDNNCCIPFLPGSLYWFILYNSYGYIDRLYHSR